MRAHEIDDFWALSLDIGMGRYSIEDCRRIVRKKAALIERVLAATFTSALVGADARTAFTILDTCKSLVTRRISVHRRAKALGFELDIMTGLMTDESAIDNYLRDHPAVCVCSLYLGLDGQTWCVFAYSAGNQGDIHYEAARLVNVNSAADFLAKLEIYANSLASRSPDFTVQASLLQQLGAALLPVLVRLEIHGKFVFIPHRLLHLLPLHCMSVQFHGQSIYIDQLVNSITYSSSLFEMYSPRIVAGQNGFENRQARMLAVLDFSSTDLTWLRAERLYYEGLQRMGFPVDIVIDEKDLPRDLSEYIWISWGGHAQSDPANWGGSILALGNTCYYAREIALEWTCSFKPWVLLGACESAVDSAEIAQIDEYCGLDMAFIIAGAWGTFATMWPVKDETAAFANIFLTGQILFNQKEPAEALVALQRMQRAGKWKQKDDNRFSSELSEILRMLEPLPDDAFASLSDWGVFRSYGISY